MIDRHAMRTIRVPRQTWRKVASSVRHHRNARHRDFAVEAGYALLAVIFLAATMLLAAAIAAPVLVTQGRREKEEEMIWRGEQHVRAIKLYYRKLGRFPKSLDDLNKAQNGIHFLRKPFKDPMNKDDGSWRLIYVGPGGQLMGSITRKSLVGFPVPTPPGQTAASKPPATPPNPLPTQRVVPNPTGGQNPATGEESTEENISDANPSPMPPPLAPPKTAGPDAGTPVEGQVFGGNLIGVASKVNKPSIKFYNGYGKYKEWEFIWDPQAEAAAAAGVTAAPAAVTPGGMQPSPFPQQQPALPTPNPPQ
jgi:type II secretory pathway pseudopilin PulG